MSSSPGSVTPMALRVQLLRQRGMAMIFTMLAVIVIGATLAVIMLRVQGIRKDTDSAVDMVALEEAAQAGIDMAIKRLWNDYITTSGNTTQNWASYRFYLDNTLAIPKNEDLNFNGVQDSNEVGDGRNGFEKYPTGYDRRGWAMLNAPVAIKNPETNTTLATINSIHIARYDDPWASFLTVRSTATVDGKQKTAVQVMEIGSGEKNHTSFAILANNVNCILCHAEFLQGDLERNTSAANYNTYDRIKVAALESLMLRPTEADTKIAGTLYTRGVLKDNSGATMTASQLSSSTMKGYAFNNTNGKLTQSNSGAKTVTNLSNGTKNSSGDLNPFSTFYMNYPTAVEDQTDGEVPNSFPAPYEDANNNRKVDDAEFDVAVATSNGAISFQYGPTAPSGVKAGIAYGLPSGTAYTGTGLPTASNGALNTLSSSDPNVGGKWNGNLFLVGTAQDPIVINKSVAVNGDLVIAGPIKGEGLLNVRGNVYVVGDVTYADAAGKFGEATDGTENALAIQAGGNILMGDYLTIRGVNHSSENSAKYPDWTKYSIDSRNANKSANVTVSSKTESLAYGYKDAYSNDPGAVVSGRPGQQTSFTQSELMLFNRMELNKAIADSAYKPRFYGLRESQPNNIYLYTHATDEHTVKYDETSVKLLSSYISSQGLPANILTRATYQYLNPKSNWLSESTLRNIWFTDEQGRPSSKRDFKFDGLLYSNNAIFTMVRSDTRHGSNTAGRMTIRGGIIAADLGMFIPGPGSGRGLSMLYDPRVERFLTPHDASVVAFKRQSFYFENAA